MADYHIYLHGENSQGSKTAPFSQRSSEQSSESGSGFATGVKKAYQGASMIANDQVASTGVAALAKAVPWVAAVIAAVKITDHVLSTGFAHQQEYTGNYKNNVNYNNFKAVISMFTSPVGTMMKVFHTSAQIQKANKETTEQNKLVGESIYKTFKVGV